MFLFLARPEPPDELQKTIWVFVELRNLDV
jgi:hypothetical protein